MNQQDSRYDRNGVGAIAFHVVFLVFILAPLVVVCLVAFTPDDFLSIPTRHFSLRWFASLMNDEDFLSALRTSLWLGVTSATVSTVLAVPAAMGLARYRFPGRAAINSFLLSPLMIPPVVLGIAFLRLFTLMNMGGSFVSLVACHALLIFPYALRLIMAALVGQADESERAARSLGAGRWTTFRRITLPAILPGLAGGWVLAFINSFDELTATIFVTAPTTITLPVRIYMNMSETVDPSVAAISTLLIGLTLAVMLILDRVYGLNKVLIGNH
ncbi:ABC transporter permease [Pandoraea sp. XJJ-1]|uniref:ABC transporter permease n=2 Tax=Burkholderiaceae TaxID=119060 RepID=A0A5E4WN61_9BURK|nr:MULTISPECIES: ABC transporter permease [Pandoraea]MBN9115657.1 ABC transporter permease [Pandoraea sp.]OJY23421.1 MAG: ABC transporter permease [Pandoraea sp. 64-18]QBC32314.1 ABC transporter permease [Pandoraea sp. XY-2]WAL81178.1 ABC transporter permease [Pandoraea sp. XJJ-1]VVE25044.1 ABC transporter permease [Pandoraea cepalis]